jgi:Carboxypeptidase regulatory-like domain
MVPTIYNCSQQQAYNACRIAWRLCQQYLMNFAAYKSNYTQAFIDQNLALIEAADALDDHKARYSTVKQTYVALTKERDNVTDLFIYLKGYITQAFAADVQSILFDEAGQQYFADASVGKWASMTGLLSSMLPFVAKYEAALKEKGYAPADFLARVQAGKAQFEAVYATLKTEEDAASGATDEKVIATNAIFTNALAMLSDGKIVFKRDDVLSKKFVWANVLAQTRGTKNAGLTGFVTEISTKKGIKDADVTCVETGKTTKTDADGRFDLSPLAASNYTFQVVADGFASFLSEERKIDTGVVGRMNVEMSASASRQLVRQKAAKE